MSKVINIIFILCFMLALVVPLGFADWKGGKISERENRYFSTRPPIQSALKDPALFIRRFDEWLADNIGFRQKFIDYYSLVKKMENSVQSKEGQYVFLKGERGHRYFAHTDGWMIGKFQGKPHLTDKELQGLAAGLNQTQAYLDEKGIPFIVMFCADKETIYPEFYPKSIARGKGPDSVDTITDYVKTHTTVDVFNIKEALFAQKKEHLLFNKSAGDLLHYNDLGAFFSYQELMKHINVYLPNIKVFTLDDMDVLYKDEDKSVYPDNPNTRLKGGVAFKRIEDEAFPGNITLASWSVGALYGNEDTTLPTILILRDSYMGDDTFMSQYMPEHFGKTVLFYYRHTNMDFFVKIVDHFKPDIVVFQAAEREFRGFSEYVEKNTRLPLMNHDIHESE